MDEVPGLSHTPVVLLFASLPVAVALRRSGPRLLAGLGAALVVAGFAIPWQAVTVFYDQRIEHNQRWFTDHADSLSWLLLAGCVMFVAIVTGALRSRGAVQATFALVSVGCFVALMVAAIRVDDTALGLNTPAGERNHSGDGLLAYFHDPAFPEALTLLGSGLAFLLGAALWQWRTTTRKHPAR